MAGLGKEIIFDEIALEGLEGITLSALWTCIQNRLQSRIALGDKTKELIWQIILQNSEHFTFYELPEARPVVEMFNRFENLDPEWGVIVSRTGPSDRRQKYNPVQDGEIWGSCQFYKERKRLPIKDLHRMTVVEVSQKWSHTFVIVASQELRYNALVPSNIARPRELSAELYCLLEAIGRSRYNGECTSGAFSLLDFCKDSTVVFYLKKKLKRFGLISCQLCNEMRNERISLVTLVSLVRFQNEFKSFLLQVLEKLHSLVQNAPGKCLELGELRALYPTEDNRKRLKKFRGSHLFSQVFETRALPSNPKNKSDDKSKKARKSVVFYLRNPNASLEDILEGEEEKEETQGGSAFHDDKHSYLDMPMKEEYYRAVAKYGSRGCSQAEWGAVLAESHMNVRSWTKRMLANGLIVAHRVDAGRQRTTRYVAIEHAAKADSDKNAVIDMHTVTVNEEPSLTSLAVDAALPDVPSITAFVKPYTYGKVTQSDVKTNRHLIRKAIIINAINESDLIQTSELRIQINRMEREKGLKDEVCSKSVRRLLSMLADQNLLRLYEIQLQHEYCTRQYVYATHPKINMEHEAIRHETIKLKHALFCIIAERRTREVNRLASQQVASPKKTQMEMKQMQLNRNAQKPPKFLIARCLHELLFYVIEGNRDGVGQPITRDLLESWQLKEPALPIVEHMDDMLSAASTDNPLVYSKKLGWQTFIPPLPKYSEIPHGWIHFADVVERIPLSLFNKIFRIDTEMHPIFKPYLKHPVQQHYILRQVPVELQSAIHCAQVNNTYRRVLKVLNNMGLIQVGECKSLHKSLTIWIYLNRKTTLLDTTSSNERYASVDPDLVYPSINVHLRSGADLLQYWTNLQRICVLTKLGFKHGRDQERNSKAIKEMQFLPRVSLSEAPSLDTGAMPGDHLGAAGLQSFLFAHVLRSWSWRSNSNQLKMSMDVATRSRSMNSYKHHVKNLRRKARTLGQTKLKVTHGKAHTAAKTATTTKKPAKTSPRDAIDEDALKNMSTLRVKWSKQEDTILKIARAVYLYIAAPVSTLGMLTVGKICRDLLRHNLCSVNKTCQACVRRSHFLRKVRRDQPEVTAWLYILQTNEQIQGKFGNNLMARLKKAHPNRENLNNAVAVQFILLTNELYRIIHRTEVGVKTQTQHNCDTDFQMPQTVHQFWSKYKMHPELALKSDDPIPQYTNPQTDTELQVLVAMNVLHSSMCSARDKTPYNLHAFEIYKHFSEDILQVAFERARRDCLVVAIKRKNIQMASTHMTGQTYVLSSKYRARLSYLKLPYEIYDHLYGYWQVSAKALHGDPGHLLLKTPNLAHLCYVAESLASSQLRVHIKLPVNMLTMNSEQQPNDNDLRLDRTFSHYQNILEYAPKTEYTLSGNDAERAASACAAAKQAHVKFQTANLRYTINYSPYDLLAKLPSRHLHFFCALNNLNREIELDFERLYQPVDGIPAIVCPFSHCVMNDANYIKTIDYIVKKHHVVLPKLTLDPAIQAKIANPDSVIKIIILQYNNFLPILDMLEKFWCEKEAAKNRKDLGKIPSTSSMLHSNSSIDMVQICREILNCDSNEEKDNDLRCDEYEANFNKDDCMARVQDVFVINMCSLILRPVTSGGQLDNPEESTNIDSDRVLAKILNESCWKYTDESWPKVKAALLATLQLNDAELLAIEEIHSYLESQPYGVGLTQLNVRFPTDRVMLAVQLLKQHNLIRRMGVALPVYVHKANMHKWLVQTFHLKRLEREGLPSGTVALKRRRESLHKNKDASHDIVEAAPPKRTKRSDESMPEDVPVVLTDNSIAAQHDRKESERAISTSESKDIIIMRPQPWIRLNGSINRRVLDRWLGAILTDCVASSGCTVDLMCQAFPHMFPVDVMFLLEILRDLNCIQLHGMTRPPAGLFSTYSAIKPAVITEISSPTDTYITACAGGLTRFSSFIGHKKYSTEFI